MYREYNDKGNKSIPSLEIRNSYPYRLYLQIENGDLIIHRDYTFKGERDWSFYFSKKLGLYKIVFIEGGQCELIKIDKK